MASTRPPGTYSRSARTGRRGGESGGVAGMVRRAGSDALPMSLRSTAPVDSSAASIRRRNRPNTAFRPCATYADSTPAGMVRCLLRSRALGGPTQTSVNGRRGDGAWHPRARRGRTRQAPGRASVTVGLRAGRAWSGARAPTRWRCLCAQRLAVRRPASAAAGAARTQRSGLGVALLALRNPPQHKPGSPGVRRPPATARRPPAEPVPGSGPRGAAATSGGSAAEGGFHVGGGRGGVGRHRQRAGVHRQRQHRPLRRDDGGIDAQHRVSGDGARPEAGREHAGRR